MSLTQVFFKDPHPNLYYGSNNTSWIVSISTLQGVPGRKPLQTLSYKKMAQADKDYKISVPKEKFSIYWKDYLGKLWVLAKFQM